MKESLLKRCELFVQNVQTIKTEFRWENGYMYPLCAGLCIAKETMADAAALRACHDLLKQNTGLLSSFRGTPRMATITMLSLSPNPQERLERILEVYGRLKEVFWGSAYLIVAATAIADLAEPSEYEQIAQHTREIYTRMKEQHPLLTSGEDSAFAALLALSGLDDQYIEEEMERCYSILRPFFFMNGNAVQSLSHVLALGEASAEQKCKKALELIETLKASKHKYGVSYELATLGALVLMDIDVETLAREMMDADDFLKTQKGFGSFGIGAHQRLMYAGMLTMCEYMPDAQTMRVAALNGVVSLIVAQQAAVCASIAAAGAASAASGNH